MKTISYIRKVLIIPLLFVSACKVGPDYKVPELALPEGWLESSEKTIAENKEQAEWWKNFSDPTLDELIEKARKQNLDLREAEARVKEARALSRSADAQLYPEIGVGGSITKRSKNGGTGNNTELFEAGFDALWEADIFGQNRRLSESAEADAQSVEAQRDDVMLSLIGEITRSYIEVRLYQEQLQLAKQTLDIQTNTSRITTARYEEGVEGKLEVTRAEAQASSTKAQIPLYENLLGAATYRLEFLLAQQPGTLKEVLADAKPIPFADPIIATGAPLDVIKRRPDIRAAERNLASATALQGAAIADWYPKLSLSAVLGLESNKADDLFRSSSKVWSIGGSLLAPLFDFGRIRANVDATDARQEQAMIAYERSVLAALQDVETALLAYAKESARMESLADAAEKSRKAVEISQLQYKEGIISQLDVLQAQQTLYASENTLNESRADVSYYLTALYKSLAW